jgi:hypothetical protein
MQELNRPFIIPSRLTLSSKLFLLLIFLFPVDFNEPVSFFSLSLQPSWALASAFSFMIIFTDGRTPWTSHQLVARPLPKHRTTQTQNKHLHTPNIHALCSIRTHDPSFQRSEDSSCLRPLGYCDRHRDNFTLPLSLPQTWGNVHYVCI